MIAQVGLLGKERPAAPITDRATIEQPLISKPFAAHPDRELAAFPRWNADGRVGGDGVVELEIPRNRRQLTRNRPHQSTQSQDREYAHDHRHRMPHPHERSIPGSVRFLYIALAAALLGPPTTGTGAADDTCLTAPAGTPCEDDDDPCTVDQCAAGTCGHVDVPNRSTCEPLVDAYRRTLGLSQLLHDLRGQFTTITLPETAFVLVTDALAAATGDLLRSSDALAGRIAVPPPAAGETLAQARARAAFGIARGTPPRILGILKVLRVPAVRAAGGPNVVDLARRTRFLYRSTNQLRRELRRLQRVSGVFAR